MSRRTPIRSGSDAGLPFPWPIDAGLIHVNGRVRNGRDTSLVHPNRIETAMQPTWILVADAARARLFASGVIDGALNELEDIVNPEGRRTDPDASRDRPPRVMESMGHMSHAIAPHTSPEEKVADRFARELNELLERGRVEHRYERLILVAPPRFLGALQGALGKHVRDCVVAHVDKDLTTLPAMEIQSRLASKLLH